MPYFQNVSNSEFIGIYAISDRQYAKDYRIRPNQNSPTLMMNWVGGPYDLSTANLFGIKYSMDAGTTWNQINVTLTAGSAQTADNVVNDLNTNTSFAAMFTASTIGAIPGAYAMSSDLISPNGPQAAAASGSRIFIKANTNMNTSFRAYIPNLADPNTPSTSAEQVLLFNLKAPVVEMPSYFARYTIGNMAGAVMVELSQPNENFVITNAGLSTTPLADWQMLAGSSGYFQFYNNTLDAQNRIISSIEYPAGAQAGDLARKTTYHYPNTTTTNPDYWAQVPYTLQSGDLITPP